MKARSYRIHDRGMLMRVASLLSQMLVSEDKPLLVEISEKKDPKTRQQEKLFHAILGDAAEQVFVNGQTFSAKAWKEHFAEKYIGTEELRLPTGEIRTMRKSTTDLNVEEYSALIDQTLAELAREFGYLPQEMAA